MSKLISGHRCDHCAKFTEEPIKLNKLDVTFPGAIKDFVIASSWSNDNAYTVCSLDCFMYFLHNKCIEHENNELARLKKEKEELTKATENTKQ